MDVSMRASFLLLLLPSLSYSFISGKNDMFNRLPFRGGCSDITRKMIDPMRLYDSAPKMWNFLSFALKDRARGWFIDRAEKKGIKWYDLLTSYSDNFDKIKEIYDDKTNTSMVYPKYYTRPFHGYDDGNLNWLAAFEGDAATLSMASGYWNGVDPFTTASWLRFNITNNIQHYMKQHRAREPVTILDVGSSVGISTEYLYRGFKSCEKAAGIDLSPYFIAVATYRAEKGKLPFYYYHQNAEDPHINQTFDTIVFTYILHEVPREETRIMIDRMKSLLRPNGVMAIVDLDPEKLKSSLLLSKFRKWAFEVTEPHVYEYYNTNLSDILKEKGFVNVEKVSNDPINSIWMGQLTNKD